MQLHEYQKAARNFLFHRLQSDRGAGLWLEPGLGKTATTLHTILTLRDFGYIDKATIVAPARVIATSWPKEIHGWGLPFTYGWLKGDYDERDDIIRSNPDITFISAENLPLRTLSEKSKAKRRFNQLSEWLLKRKYGTDLLVLDEVTKFKSWSSSRSKVLRKLLPNFEYRITLTGTPTPNGLGDIFSQHYFLDSGKTLSPYITHFQNRFMRPCGFENRQWEMRPEMVDTLKSLLAPWYLSGTALEHLDMPELVVNEIEVDLPPAAAEPGQALARRQAADAMRAGFRPRRRRFTKA